MIYFFIIILSIAFGLLYVRYYPVTGIPCADLNKLDKDKIEIVDVREYNLSYKDPIPETTNLPVAYIKRNCSEISSLKVHVVASDLLEKNIGIRTLRKKGFHVTGYTIKNCDCNQSNTA